jgi:hypothetical protein
MVVNSGAPNGGELKCSGMVVNSRAPEWWLTHVLQNGGELRCSGKVVNSGGPEWW